VPNALRTTLDAVARHENISLNVILEADSLPIQKRIAADGDAYAIVGRLAVTEEVKLGSLQASRIVDPPIKRVAILAAGAQGNHGPAVRRIAQLLEPLAIGLLEDG
jgi:DNA-binding transcriptional LysR family regulator